MKCIGSNVKIGKTYCGGFECPECDASWATSETDDIIVPEHDSFYEQRDTHARDEWEFDES